MVNLDIVAGLDVGNENIRALIAEFTDDGRFSVSGYSVHKSRGIEKGEIVNVEEFADSVSKTMREAENQAGRNIEDVLVTYGCAGVELEYKRGVLSISSRDGVIRRHHVDEVVNLTKKHINHNNRSIIQVIPERYTINSERSIADPVAMRGDSLEADIYLVTVAQSAVHNLESSMKKAGYGIQDISLGILASAGAVLYQDEQLMNVLMIDIGAYSTDFLIINNNVPRFTGWIPAAGGFATSDLAQILNVNFEDAEYLKHNYGSCWIDGIDANNDVHHSEKISERDLLRVLQPRVKEIFQLIHDKLPHGNNPPLSHVVLTGAGAMLDGIPYLAEHIFSVPARLGNPGLYLNCPEAIKEPCWAAAAGLVLSRSDTELQQNHSHGRSDDELSLTSGVKRVLGKFF